MTELFSGSAAHYARHRHGYVPDVIAHIAAALSLGPDTRLLDLGCGPGTLAVPLAAYAGEVLAVDPSAEMLEEGRRLAGGVSNVRWVRSDSTRLRELPAFGHVVMGRSFHWMRRAEVLADLDELLPPGGAVVLAGAAGDRPGAPWAGTVRRVRDELGLTWRAPRENYAETGLHHTDVLAASPFADVSETVFTRTAERDADDVVGLQLSLSPTSPDRLGDRLEEYRTVLRRELLADNPAGVWRETVSVSVLVARRPGEAR